MNAIHINGKFYFNMRLVDGVPYHQYQAQGTWLDTRPAIKNKDNLKGDTKLALEKGLRKIGYEGD